MSYVPGSGGNTPSARPHLPATAGRDGLDDRTAAEAGLERESAVADRVGWTFISLYTLAYISTSLLFLAPLLVTLALSPLVSSSAPSSPSVSSASLPS